MYQLLKNIPLWVIIIQMVFIVYGQTIEDVEDNKNKIFGGMSAQHGEFPWQVAIWIKDEIIQTYDMECGGSIIERQWVITAAHCLYGFDSNSIMIQIGKTNLNQIEPYENIIDISKYIIHPEYNFKLTRDDIGLIKLSEPLEFNRDVSPITISRPAATFENMICITSGWGLTSFNGKVEREVIPNLQRVSLYNWPDEKCAKHPNYICSGGFPEGGKGACKGDSGGPIQCFVDEEYVLIGLVSHGKSCGSPNEPDYSTSISYYHYWIIDTIFQDV